MFLFGILTWSFGSSRPSIDRGIDPELRKEKMHVACKSLGLPWKKHPISRIGSWRKHVNLESRKCLRSDPLEADILKVIYSNEQVHQRVAELGRMLARELSDKRPLVLGVLTGAFVFTADLVREMQPCPRGTTIKFVKASSYGKGTVSSKQVTLTGIDEEAILGRNILIVEDIVDTGRTLTSLREYLMEKGAASVTIVVLLDKKERRELPIPVDYTGFVCPDEFVVGFGLDYAEEYRSLPFIGVLKPEVYS